MKIAKQIFFSLITLDALIVITHLIWGHQNQLFHLDYENNLPTYYQSLKLIIFGVYFTFIGVTSRIKREVISFVVPLGAILCFIGIDELFQIHENVYKIFEIIPWLSPSVIVDGSLRAGYRSSLWILYYLPLIVGFVLWCGYWLRYFQSKLRSNISIVILSMLCLTTVLVAELIGTTGKLDNESYFFFITLEELSEMLLATTLILVGNKTLVFGLSNRLAR